MQAKNWLPIECAERNRSVWRQEAQCYIDYNRFSDLLQISGGNYLVLIQAPRNSYITIATPTMPAVSVRKILGPSVEGRHPL